MFADAQDKPYTWQKFIVWPLRKISRQPSYIPLILAISKGIASGKKNLFCKQIWPQIAASRLYTTCLHYVVLVVEKFSKILVF